MIDHPAIIRVLSLGGVQNVPAHQVAACLARLNKTLFFLNKT